MRKKTSTNRVTGWTLQCLEENPEKELEREKRESERERESERKTHT